MVTKNFIENKVFDKNPSLYGSLSDKKKNNFNFNEIKKFQKFKTVVIIGMGGSILGSKALYSFLRHKIKKNFIFIDNLDFNLLKSVNIKKDASKFLFIIISKSFSDPVKGDKISSIFALIGFINIPIIKFSVDIWSTLHQTATISKIDTPSIHIDMIIPLLIMFISFVFLFLYIFSIRFFSELNLRRYVTYTLSIK